MGHPALILRPYGLFISGELRLGLEIVREEGRVVEVRPHTGVPEDFLVSVPFVNAHSHFEYRGLQGRLQGLPYWKWIRELTTRKAEQSPEIVREDCRLAAAENRRTGVALVGEHSDRPFSGEAMTSEGLDGILFQEVITFFESETREEKIAQVKQNLEQNRRAFSGTAVLNPHALYTVDPSTLRELGATEGPISLHLAESVHEREFYSNRTGPIMDFYRRFGVDPGDRRGSPVAVAREYGLVRQGAQIVHACDLDSADVEMLAQSDATVAHCPRSNRALGCPDAPVFELLRARVDVGLGLDSAASSGPIDMFAEMRAALEASLRRGRPISGEDVWNMATAMGARTLGRDHWDLVPGFEGPLVKIRVPMAEDAEMAILSGSPEHVEWVN